MSVISNNACLILLFQCLNIITKKKENPYRHLDSSISPQMYIQSNEHRVKWNLFREKPSYCTYYENNNLPLYENKLTKQNCPQALLAEFLSECKFLLFWLSMVLHRWGVTVHNQMFLWLLYKWSWVLWECLILQSIWGEQEITMEAKLTPKADTHKWKPHTAQVWLHPSHYMVLPVNFLPLIHRGNQYASTVYIS